MPRYARFEHAGLLSDDLRDIIAPPRARGRRLSPVALAVLAAIALATWSVQDPSLSHATNGAGAQPARACRAPSRPT